MEPKNAVPSDHMMDPGGAQRLPPDSHAGTAELTRAINAGEEAKEDEVEAAQTAQAEAAGSGSVDAVHTARQAADGEVDEAERANETRDTAPKGRAPREKKG